MVNFCLINGYTGDENDAGVDCYAGGVYGGIVMNGVIKNCSAVVAAFGALAVAADAPMEAAVVVSISAASAAETVFLTFPVVFLVVFVILISPFLFLVLLFSGLFPLL